MIDLQRFGGKKIVGEFVERFLHKYRLENTVDLEETEALENIIN